MFTLRNPLVNVTFGRSEIIVNCRLLVSSINEYNVRPTSFAHCKSVESRVLFMGIIVSLTDSIQTFSFIAFVLVFCINFKTLLSDDSKM